MILTYKCRFGQLLDLQLAERFGAAVEIKALEFVNALPIEWRLITPQDAVTPWRPAMRERKTLPFHDLQVYRDGGTHGTGGKDVSLETRGIGEATVLVWLRERTYSAEKLIKLEA
jgi:hypothetical protein